MIKFTGADTEAMRSSRRKPARHSAQTLLEGGPAAVAIAPANFRSTRDAEVRRIGLLADPDDHAAFETAHSLAEQLDAELTQETRHIDLLVVGSRAEAPDGRVMISARAQSEIDNTSVPVLVVARGVTLQFAAQIAVY